MENLTAEVELGFTAPIVQRREELKAKHGERLNHWSFLENPLTSTEIEQRNRIIELAPKTVKVFCNAGKNRSKFVADILNGLGYEADNAGTTGAEPFTENDFAEGYDAIIFVTDTVKEAFYNRAEALGLHDKLKDIPSRVLNFPETGVFYLGTEQKSEKLSELEPKIKAALDRIGFIKKGN